MPQQPRRASTLSIIQFLLLLWLVLTSDHVAAATLACPGSNTLEALVDCISLQMPRSGSNGYVAPTLLQRTDFRKAVARMLNKECEFPLESSIAANMVVRRFDDANGRQYCVLMETADSNDDGFVDKGWGTFITFADARRELSQQAPHPKYAPSIGGVLGDNYTEREAIRIFKQTDSRSYLMCGARRDANAGASTCDPDYMPADCAHNDDNMFHAATVEMNQFYAATPWSVVQWHSKGPETCSEDIYMSHGFNLPPGADSPLLQLQLLMAKIRPQWVVNVPPSSECDLNATDNVQGRMLNDVAPESVCKQKATFLTQKFIHIEQTSTLIANIDGIASGWSSAVRQWASVAPTAPLGVGVIAGTGQAIVTFTAPQDNGGTPVGWYELHCAGGLMVAGFSSPMLIAGLANDVKYSCTLSARNAAGLSAPSPPLVFTPSAIAITQLAGAVSRKVHQGVLGTVDLPLAVGVGINGVISIEPRMSKQAHNIVLFFNNPVASMDAATAQDALGTSYPLTSSFSGSEISLLVPDIPNASRVLFSVAGVNGLAAPASVAAAFLTGDLSFSGRVNAADIAAMRQRMGVPLTRDNFVFDLDQDGQISEKDMAALRARSGSSLTPN